MGREGILPLSRLWASNKPFNAPFMGLFEHWLVSVVIILAPPPGDAYNFILNLISYPLNITNAFVSAALIILYLRPTSVDRNPSSWAPPFRATLPVVIFFFLSNVYLIIAPFVPPSAGQSVYEHLPYYLHCVVGMAIFVAGGIYWLVWAVLLPKWGGYELVRQETDMEDGSGWTRTQFIKNKIK